MAMNIQRVNFTPVGGDSVTGAFRKLDLDVGELVNAIDGDGSASSGLINRMSMAEQKLAGAALTSYTDATFLTKANPTFSGSMGIGRTGVKFEYTLRVSNAGTDNGIGGAYAEWAGNLTPALQIDCQAASSHYLGMRWTHWGVRHLAAIHAYEGGDNSNTVILGFHIAGKTNSHIFDSNGNAFFAGALQQNSDYRIKTEKVSIEPHDTAGRLRQLNPITYADNRRPAGDSRLAGLLAHELQEQFPLLVDGVKDAVRKERVWVGDTTPYLPGTEPEGHVPPHQVVQEVPVLQNVNYIGLVPYLIAGWQDSDRRIGDMEAEVAVLRSQVAALLAR